MNHLENGTDLIVFSSHSFGSKEVRTSAVAAKFAPRRKVYFIESPKIGKTTSSTYYLHDSADGVHVVQPYLPNEMSIFEQKEELIHLLKELIHNEHLGHYTVWTDTPKSMCYIRNISAEMIVYDKQFDYSEKFPELEQELREYCDVILKSALDQEHSSHY